MKTEEGKEEVKEDLKENLDKSTTAEPQAAETPQEAKEPTKKASERAAEKFGEYEDSVASKYPKMASKWSYFKEVWQETFPDPERAMNKKMEARKKMAQMQREHDETVAKMTQEERDAMEAAIPEWKRGALVVTEPEAAEKKEAGLLRSMKNKVSEKIGRTEAAKKFQESEEYSKIREMRANYQEFRG